MNSPNSRLELTYECPQCKATGITALAESPGEATCRQCGATRALKAGSTDHGKLEFCPWCATTDLYIQKDFPEGLGLAIVTLGFVVSTVYWYYERPIPAFAVLLASALLDMVLYYKVPDVTICYRCLSQIRGQGANPDERLHPFDLAVGERYRQERLRIEQMREGRTSPGTSPPPPG
jgi:hypothetical protein